MDLQALWDFDDPVGSERRFRKALEGELDPSLRVEVLTQIARAQGLERRFADARETLDTAARLEHTDRGTIRIALERGRVDRSEGNADAARPYFIAAWDLARAVGEDGLAVDAAHMLALVLPPEEAIAWNVRALELAETSADPDARRWVGSLAHNLAWAHHDRGDPATALVWFERALDTRRVEGDVGRGRIARWSVARCLRTLGRLDEALDLQRGLAAELDAAGVTDGYVFEEIGECLLGLDRAEDARPWFARAHLELTRDASLVEDQRERLERLRELSVDTDHIG
jgi:tetratricopeptide (TPR) repeat protein